MPASTRRAQGWRAQGWRAQGWRLAAVAIPAAVLAVAQLSASALAAPAALASAPGGGRSGRAEPAGPVPASRRLGSVTVRRCARVPVSYCGEIRVPVDYSRPAVSPTIRIGFRWLPATRRPRGTILAVEGGPGYASTGSQSLYQAMIGPLARTRNLLLIDLRGTGTSTPVNCPGLERYGRVQHQYGPAFGRLVGQCGRRLNHTWRYSGGGWVHASDLFNTAYSAADVSRVLHALHQGRADLYGDSYGSWFAQVFAARYPGQLRSVTLDSTYQVLDLDPWYTTTVVTARRAFDRACARWPACKAAARANAWATIAALDRRLARAPVSGETSTGAGRPGRFTVTTQTLVNLVNNAGFDPAVYRDLDAAARALLRQHFAAPLLRLAALSVGFDDSNEPLNGFSGGLYFAVSCTDYPQLFSRTAPPAVRARQYRAALRRERPRTFAPFSVAQWTRMDQYTEAYSGCLDWPSPARLVAPITLRPPLVPARLPVLILSGTLDSLTPRLHGATLVARQIGPSARLVTVANLTHVTLQDANDGCPAAIYQQFVRDPAGLARQDTSCAAAVTPVHSVGRYPASLAAAIPAAARPGSTASRRARQAAALAVAAVGDEISRWPLLAGDTDRGLLGGQIRFTSGAVTQIRLRGVRPAAGAVIDGTARWDQASGRVTARLTVHLSRGAPVTLTARWLAFAAPGQRALITGRQGHRRLAAVTPAP
ncbi:MAG: alpha/beta hydrolase [Streptosporangiaceae bacterium]